MPQSVVVLLALLVVVVWPGRCARPGAAPLQHVENAGTMFTRMPAAYTGIAFENRLRDTQAFNVFTYRNYYNGGGVGIGDVNGDGLADIFLTANQLPNRLFLNQGNFRFTDITRQAGVSGTHKWSTGVSLTDVNGDGLLDIYVCNAGDLPGDDRANELFINQGPDGDGIPVFKEMAAVYGLDDGGYATHATFFDYDRDGDLDLYLVNNSPRPVSSFGLKNTRHIRHDGGGDKLFRNEDGRFVDVSEEAGIYGSEMAFGLGVSTGDLNNDGWPDLYISNDFFERDYLYLNNGDGTFTDTLEAAMPVISLSSMGADLADVNNDGFAEIYVTDMLPEDDYRLKTTSTYESWAAYQQNVAHGYHHQFMRNTLQVNNGDPRSSPGQAPTFSEVGQMAGVSATDWSWGALFADFDLDGYKDLFVSNGVFRDVIDQDYIDFLADRRTAESVLRGEEVDFLALVEEAPSTPLPNYLSRNNGDLTFTNQAAAWGVDEASFSNGAAYGDLDNDGDLDLVVNNVNQEVFVYRNDADSLLDTRYLQVALVGEGMNRYGVGAKITARHGAQVFALEQMPARGFQSSVDPVLTMGLGAIDTVEALTVTWPDGRVQTVQEVPANQRLTLRQANATPALALPTGASEPTQPLFADVTEAIELKARHTENAFVDFDRGQLYPRMFSTEGPPLAVADVNGDGLDDFYLGGAKESPGQLFVQQRAGGFTAVNTDVFSQDAISEDVGAAFFDADGDGDPDLYVVSGGNEFSGMAPALLDRLYLNDGRGGFEKASGRLPSLYHSGSCVRPADVDGDGDLDLFVCGRLVPWRYGEAPASYLLENDGTGHFTDATERIAPALAAPGLVTDAAWMDVDGDGRDDLVLAGEWMPVTVLRNAGGRLVPHDAGLGHTHGLWNCLLADDLDGDGDVDFVAGNWGLNSKFRASLEEPLTMHVYDFGRNGSVEQIISIPQGGTHYPMVLRHELLRSLPYLQERFPTHASYAEKTVKDVFLADELQGATVHRVYTLHSATFENQGDGTFTMHALPGAAQRAPVYGLLAEDLDLDGHTDLLLGGNFYAAAPSIGRLEASYGLFLKGRGTSRFEPVSAQRSGLHLRGQIRDMKIVRDASGRRLIIIAKNDAPVQVLQALLRRESL